MKRTKLLTSLAALALVIGLGACEETEVEEPSDDSSESVDIDTTDTTTGEGGDTGDDGDGDGNTGDTGNDGDGDGDTGDTGDDGDDGGDGDTGDTGGDGDGDGNDDGDGDTGVNTETETLTVDADLGEDNGHEYSDYYYLDGVTLTNYLTSCDITFSGTSSEYNIQAFSSYIRLKVGSSITFTPKTGYKLVEISFTYYNNPSGTALSAGESATSVTYDSTGATISGIVDGSTALTVTNVENTGAIDFSAITISYL